MHPEALAWVARWATPDRVSVLDLGGRDNNGSPRALFPHAEYTVVDLTPGPDVDVVADAALWEPDREFDLVLSTELFEHTPDWRDVLRTAHKAARPGGRLVATMAGPHRPPHGQHGAASPAGGEHYRNIHPDELREALLGAGWGSVVVDEQLSPSDVRCTAVKP